jgi:bacillithiol system protein YtxJ
MAWFGGLFGKRPAPAEPAIPEAASVSELMSAGCVLVFKHSTACPMSWAAHSQVTRMAKENPGLTVRMVRVIQERALSAAIAEATGVRHESPQLIVLRRGEVVGTAAHGGITCEKIGAMLETAGENACLTNPLGGSR